MQRLDRRQILKTTGTGAGIALGAGSVSTGGVGATSEGDQTGPGTDQSGTNNVSTFTAIAQEGTVAISADDTSNPLADPATISGAGIEISGDIDSQAGTWTATDLSVGDLTTVLDSIDIDAEVEELITDLDLNQAAQDIILDDLLDDIVAILDAPSYTEDQITHITTIINALLKEFLGQDSQTIGNLVVTLIENPDRVTLESILDFVIDDVDYQNDTLQDLLDQFLDEGQTLEGTILGLLEDVSLNQLVADLADGVEVVPNIESFDIDGQFDPANDLVTVSPNSATITQSIQTDNYTIDLSIDISDQSLDVDITIDGSDLVTLSLPGQDLTLTTKTSGALTGSASGLDSTEATLELVENEFVFGLDQVALNDIVDDIDIDGLLSTFSDDIVGFIATNRFPAVHTAQIVPSSQVSAEYSAGGMDTLSDSTLANVTAFDGGFLSEEGGSGPDPSGQRLTFMPQSIDSSGEVTVQNVHDDGVDSDILVTYDDGGNGTVAGVAASSGGNWSGDDIQVALQDQSAVPGVFTAHLIATADTSSDYSAGDVLSDDTVDAVSAQAYGHVFAEGESVPSQSVDLADQTLGSDGSITIDSVDSAGVASTLFLTWESGGLSLGGLGGSGPSHTITDLATDDSGSWSGDSLELDAVTVDRDAVGTALTSLNLNTLIGDIDIDLLLDNISIDDTIGIGDIVIDEQQRHAITLDTQMEFVQTLDIDPIGDAPPQDHDGDGKFEDVLGNGERGGAFNVQALFENMDDPRIQENAAAFDFDNDGSGEVGVFDVQALFNMD